MTDAGLLTEAVPECLALKHALYVEPETLVFAGTLIASSTGGLPPEVLAEGIRHPERLLRPPHFIPLVELVPGGVTDREWIHGWFDGMELEAVVLEKAAPGFIGNRSHFATTRGVAHRTYGIADPPQWIG
ncbi:MULTISPECIES: 3-hydroxyacyl-CoA dehydrogenase NAD-binding domain-containing protein [Burkholderiaceae]|uniref:3-hydroxyacyl-CoA dehydrogenase NAD-binding domain-containing protein n=1 Tax=Burkholderiaceae TaxID=119060 RepID=UPI001ABACF22|nr:MULTISPECIES: 3-hydroxyacyl-CoA dehydrogenase NAD-binding domain-containing protein [Burkholderiaceae]